METIYTIYTTDSKQIIVLKPNYEFLMWELPSIEIELENYPPEKFEPFQLFRNHYLGAIKDHPNTTEEASKLDEEITEAWNHSDEQVHEVYKKFCSSLQELRIRNIIRYKYVYLLL